MVRYVDSHACHLALHEALVLSELSQIVLKHSRFTVQLSKLRLMACFDVSLHVEVGCFVAVCIDRLANYRRLRVQLQLDSFDKVRALVGLHVLATELLRQLYFQLLLILKLVFQIE